MVTPNYLLPDSQLDRIVEKQSLLRELDSSGLSKAEFVRSRGLCRATLFRDIAKRKEAGISGLVDKRKQRARTGIKLDDRFTEIILDHLVERPKAPIAAIHTALIEFAREHGLSEPPAYAKVRRFCRSIAADVLLQWAQGRKERVEQKALTVRRTVAVVNELWQTDFSELPIWTFEPHLGADALFKPWIVGTICAASRVVPAARVCRTVTATEILWTWKKAMLPKKTLSYPFYGVPSSISIDNHKVFKGDALQSLIALSVEPLFIVNDSPEQNGKQERWFQTLQTRLISHLDGFSDQHRGLAKAQKKCIPFTLLQKLIDDFILNYHLTEHSELKMTPWEAWHRGLAEARGLLVSGDEVDRCLRISREVKVTAEGVHLDNKRFTGIFFEGRVDSLTTARVQPEGASKSVPIFDHGMFIGDAVEHVDNQLALDITRTRLERTIAIETLAKSIREKHESLAKAPVPPSALVPAPVEDTPIHVPPPFEETDKVSDPLLNQLEPIPNLQTS